MLGKKLKEAIKRAGYTQEEFAKLINTNRALISQWITGRRNPSATNLKKISKALDLPVAFFLDNSITTGNISAREVSINSQNLQTENRLLKKEIELLKKELQLTRKERGTKK